ncbi:hypothetical protein C7B82_09715 [Stenomitos frigidus ULC18]|uniref:Uncharacterized protein n=1 Tax=Stenomitos frigidus ULC18 TaxID=2107698 RepID=A0A2T1EBB4_9CYAN|nr:hypothetical protein C7B82_09715 [Stenomitos frigidus ULC18]
MPALSTVLALLPHAEVLTIQTRWELEQLFPQMRIAGASHPNVTETIQSSCFVWSAIGCPSLSG